MEELTRSTALISEICVIALAGIIKAVNWVWLKPKRFERRMRQQSIPGTSYKFLFGNKKDIFSMHTKAIEKPMSCFSNDFLPRAEPFRHHLFTHFGNDFFFWEGPMLVITISKPKLFREAITKMQEFQNPKIHPVARKLLPGFVNYEGEKWAKHRKMLNPAFHVEKLKLMLPAFHDSCIDMINKWEKMIAETGSIELDVWPHLATLTADVISRAAFGSSYEEGQMIFELIKEQISLFFRMMQSVYIPGFRYLPTATNRRFNELENQIHILLKGIINKRKNAINAGEMAKSDLLGILMDSELKELQPATTTGKNEKPGMSLEEVIDECKQFYLSGQETTSVLLVWAIILLSKHQVWQKKARQEVSQTFGSTAPDFDGLSRLKTVTMILYEVLRLYPPVTRIHRMVCEETKLGGLSLPAGALLDLQVLFIHHDKEIWGDDAEEFKPDRFAEGISKATISANISFFPFGWGPRICIAEKFAITEAKMALSMILQRFSFELSPSYCHSPMTAFFLQPQYGAPIILHPL